MSISKITNIANNTISKTAQKISPKKVINTIAEHKTATTLGTITAGLIGLAIYSTAFLKPSSNVKFDIAEAAQATMTEQKASPKDIKKLEYENTLTEKENNLKAAQNELKKDEEQINILEKTLSIKGLINKEYYEQQYNVLKDFVETDKAKVAQCEQEYVSFLNSNQNPDKSETF
ncbi:MAG: hypothetical protein MJ229_06840 [bacterium]|nr:hypothetical protein [bacterium]